MKIHPSVTPERVVDALERHMSHLDDPGFCMACGADALGVEPDARKYVCEVCGEPAVYGAEELVIVMGDI